MITVQKILITLSISAFLLFGFSPAAYSQSSSSSQTSLELTKVGDLEVMPFMIFLETTESKPKFEGNAPANAAVVVEVNGEKNDATADASGKWTWTPTKALSGEVDLKLSSGTQSKIYRLVVKSSAPDTEEEATPSSSTEEETPEESIFEENGEEEEAEVVATPETSTPGNPLTAYLPFILGGLGVGILLLIISRILRPKQTVLSEVPPVSSAPVTPAPEPVPAPSTSWTPPTPIPAAPSANPEPVVPPPPPMPDFNVDTTAPSTNTAVPDLSAPTPAPVTSVPETPATPGPVAENPAPATPAASTEPSDPTKLS